MDPTKVIVITVIPRKFGVKDIGSVILPKKSWINTHEKLEKIQNSC